MMRRKRMVYGNENETVSKNKLQLGVAGALLLAVATVLMGSADLGTTSPAMRGDWSVVVDAAPSECGGGGRRRFDLHVDAESVHVTKPGATRGEGLRAAVSGNDLFFEVSYTNQAGLETVERVELTLRDGIMTGQSTYTELAPSTSCSARAKVFGTR
jgi:hypothetical protein